MVLMQPTPLKTLSLSLLVLTLLNVQTPAFAETPSSTTQKTSSEIHNTKKQIQALKSDIRAMKKLLNSLASKRSHTVNALEKLDREAGELHKALNQEKSALEANQAEHQQLKEKQQQLDTQKKQLKKVLVKQIRARYQAGQTSEIKLLLQQEDPHLIDRHIQYHRYILDSQNKQLDAFNQLMTEINANQQSLQQASEQIQARQAALNTKLAKLQQVKEERQLVLKKIQRDERSSKGKLSSFQKNQKELDAVLEVLKLRAAREALAKQSFKAQKGKLAWPVTARQDASYQYRRYKKGIAIPTKPYSPVKAVFNGKVVFADWLRGYGLMIIIEHQDGYMSLYAHNATIEKSVGEMVKSGDVIALSGESGHQAESTNSSHEALSTQAQLYFELRQGRKAINPTSWLSRPAK